MSKPVTDSLIQDAINYRGTQEWGDGSLLAGLMEILKMLMPFITGCMSQAAFVDSAQNPSWFQQIRMIRKARQIARSQPGLNRRERKMIAEEAVNGLLTVGESTSEDRLAACYSEHN